MWIISCCYPSGYRCDIEQHTIRAEAENNAAKLRRFLGKQFQVVVCFEAKDNDAN